MSKIYIGSIGTEIILDTGLDVSAATTRQIRFLRPNGTEGIWVASQTQTTKLLYTTLAGDLNISGLWTLQSYLVLPDWTGLGESVPMLVLDPYA